MKGFPKKWGEGIVAVKQPEFNNALKRYGITQADLARDSGVSKSMISAFASGKRLMTTTTLKKIGEIYPFVLSSEYWHALDPETWAERNAQRKQAEAMYKRNPSINSTLDKAVIMDTLTKKGWTLQDLASEAGVTVQTIYNACAGRVRPRLSTAQAIANALDVPLEKLFPEPSLCGGTRTDV